MLNRIFLLGGADLEMETIKKMLENHNEKFLTLNLLWENAFLNKYETLLSQEIINNYRIYGIELRGESKYENYTLIDHHNERENEKSSLEQIADILEIELNRYEKLVAANDRAYIPEMIKYGATNQEIKEIRGADRRAQLIKDEDEELAETSIRNNQIKIDDLVIINSLTDKFTSICDRVFPWKKLIIYNKNKLVYYGENKNKLVDYFRLELSTGRMYHGGGNTGFFGLAEKVYTESKINQLVEIIKKVIR